MVSTGVLIPWGPQKWARWSGSTMQRKTRLRGASNTRVNRSSAASGWPASPMVGALLALSRGALDSLQVRVELVETVVPELALLGDPFHRRVQRRHLEVAGAELGVPASRDE